ncbi:MAG: FAD:protein transferase [Frankiales bacterium]|nr:FAD:protein transferase [Frankiales bacterium]
MTQRSATNIDLVPRPTTLRRVEHCMGTVFSIEIGAPGCDPLVVEDVIRWLHWVDATFSTYQADSQLSRLGRGELGIDDCAPEVDEILTRCQLLETETSGYFSARAAGRLDPSGLVKGWAIQRASDLLTAAGSANHCVNGGGDVHCAGTAAGGGPWRVGIADPLQRGQLVAVVAGSDIAVATSGNAERGAHIINPHDRTSPIAIASVTLVGHELGATDAYATAAFAMGEDATAWIDTLAGYRGLVVFADGRQWASADFAR